MHVNSLIRCPQERLDLPPRKQQLSDSCQFFDSLPQERLDKKMSELVRTVAKMEIPADRSV